MGRFFSIPNHSSHLITGRLIVAVEGEEEIKVFFHTMSFHSGNYSKGVKEHVNSK
jgi:hypothetical protein